MKKKIPNPGSKKAIELGCICPVLDNSHGLGYMGNEGVFVMSAGCKVHNRIIPKLIKEVSKKGISSSKIPDDYERTFVKLD